LKLIQIHANDTVAVATEALPKGTACRVGDVTVTVRDEIPFGHKVALHPVKAGENILKYGYEIGHATVDIAAGEHVHTHNLATNLKGTVRYRYENHMEQQTADNADDWRFDGYMRADGSVGTRNELWIVPTVVCVNHTAERIVAAAKARFNDFADDLLSLPHVTGCSQLGEDQDRTMRLLSGIVHNPNAGGVLILSLGCENNNLETFLPYLGDYDKSRIRCIVAQSEDEMEASLRAIGQIAAVMKIDRRQSAPVSKLTLGLKCGGSDAFSGITANVLCGRVTDLLTAAGGSAVMSEVPEMFGAEALLMRRAKNEAVFSDLASMINGFKKYYLGYGQPVGENPSPGNKSGGITTLEEKSLGCVQKGGNAEITSILNYGEAAKGRGLHLVTGPGNDPVSCTNLTASGANLLLFTTGRGTPFGAPIPTIKISSNSALAARKPNWIDYNAGAVLEQTTYDVATKELLSLLLDVASGRIRTKNEQNGYKGISIFRNGATL